MSSVDGARHQTAAADIGWAATLELEFERRGERTVLARRSHRGPLAIQRTFHPEADGTCHAYVLHPPGGLVSGDQLVLDARLDAGARALLTTPAATKLYRSAGATVKQTQRFRVAAGARLEWLPEATIAYRGAHAALATRVELEPGAAFVGVELLCLGRPANAERFGAGSVMQRLEIFRGASPLLIERARHAGGSHALEAALGLAGAPVVGTLVCVGEHAAAELCAELRDALFEHAPGESAATALASALVCRYRGASIERAQRAFRAAWALLRRACFASPAVAPRIWAT